MFKNLLSKTNKIKKLLLPAISILNLLYFCAITIVIGYLNTFNFIWVFIAIALITSYIFKQKIIKIFNKFCKAARLIFLFCTIIFALSFFIIEGIIIKNSKTTKYQNADYIIVLGAGLNKNNPSLTLSKRINTALKYLKENKNTLIIVSGGKAAGTKISEAEAMATVLKNNGINTNRIITEDKSTNTYENLKYSQKLIDNLDKKIVIISSGFHLFRAKQIAKKIGYKNIGTIASKSVFILLPNYYFREYFAILKALFTGNI
jgi:uncharacterized SAM-binding protein YcdF (DUF218 family)